MRASLSGLSLTLVTAISLVGCSKPTVLPLASTTAPSYSAKALASLRINLAAEGLSSTQIDAIVNAASSSAASKVTTTNKTSFSSFAASSLSQSAIQLTGGAIGALSGTSAGLTDIVKRQAIAGVIVRTMTIAMKEDLQALESSERSAALSSIVGAAVAKFDEAGFSPANMSAAMKLVVASQVGALVTAGVTSADFASISGQVAAQAVRNLSQVGTLTSSQQAAIAGSVTEGISSSMAQAGLTSANMTIISDIEKAASSAAMASLGDAGFAQADYAEIAKKLSAGAVTGLGHSGLSTSDVQIAVTKINEGLVKGIASAGVSFTDTHFHSIVAGISQGAMGSLADAGVTNLADVTQAAKNILAGAVKGLDGLQGFPGGTASLDSMQSYINSGISAGAASTGLSTSDRSTLVTAVNSYVNTGALYQDGHFVAPAPPVATPQPNPTATPTSSPTPTPQPNPTATPTPVPTPGAVTSLGIRATLTPNAAAGLYLDTVTGDSGAPAGYCIPLVVTTNDASGAATPTANALIVTLDSQDYASRPAPTGHFYAGSDSQCSGTPITSVTITATHSSAVVFYKNPKSYEYQVVATAGLMTMNSAVSISPAAAHHFAFVPVDGSFFVDTLCPADGSNQYLVELRDQYENPTAYTSDIPFTAKFGTTAGLAYDQTCGNPMNTTAAASTTPFVLPAGSSSVMLQMSVPASAAGAQTLTIHPNLTLFSEVSNTKQYIVPPVESYTFQSNVNILTSGECDLVPLTPLDRFGNGGTFTTQTRIYLTVSPANADFFAPTDSTCSGTPISYLDVPVGYGAAVVFYARAKTSNGNMNNTATLISAYLNLTDAPVALKYFNVIAGPPDHFNLEIAGTGMDHLSTIAPNACHSARAWQMDWGNNYVGSAGASMTLVPSLTGSGTITFYANEDDCVTNTNPLAQPVLSMDVNYVQGTLAFKVSTGVTSFSLAGSQSSLPVTGTGTITVTP